VVVERMTGTFNGPGDVNDYRDELRRARRVFERGPQC
jgi:hypothetical protein